jgi:hypothetical protein
MIAKRLSAALAGRAWWMKLKHEYNVDDGVYVVLMPEDDNELNEQALTHIGDLVSNRNAKGVIVATNQTWVTENIGLSPVKPLALITMTDKETDGVISFFELYAFTDRLLTVSLTKPYGSKLVNAVGLQGITKEDLVCLSIYLIRDWTGTGDG